MSRPWYVVGLICLASSVAVTLILFNVLGDNGFPRGPDGKPANGPVTFAALLVFGLLITFVGMSGVITGRAISAADDDKIFTGTKARVVGGLQCLGGVVLNGASLYGFFFNG